MVAAVVWFKIHNKYLRIGYVNNLHMLFIYLDANVSM